MPDIDYQKAVKKIRKAKREKSKELTLNDLKLEKLPPELFDLENLEKLDLSNNQLSTVPESIGNLTQLQHLVLMNNQLSTVPESIGNLTQLQQLYLSFNQLGTVPESIGNLTQLQQLYLSSNQLSTVPESIGNLTQVQLLVLMNNQLSTVPESIGNLTQLQLLFLSSNQLSTVPESIGNLTQLLLLDLRNNQLSRVPESIGNLTQLQQLYLISNQLGTVPESIGNLTQLQQLYLISNQLGTVPESIGNLTQLQQLYLSSNQLSTVPESIVNLTQLQELYLSSNQFRTVPESILNLTQLQQLDLRNNQLSTVPESILNLTQLKRLDLGSNQLRTVPESIVNLTQLQLLVLSSNQLGTVPESIVNLTQLQQLYLSSNRLSTVPESIGNLTQLQELYLSSNQLDEFPVSVISLAHLQYLDLEKNMISVLPEWALTVARQITSNKPHESWKNNGLKLNGNPVEEIHEDIFGWEPEKMIQFILDKQKSQKPLHEAKVIFVGHGKVGKTSLIKRLKYNTFNPEEIQTDGIIIEEWELKRDNEDIQLHIWDFGGQEIMHSMHTFFMTGRSVYVLVTEARIEDTPEETPLSYWLSLIQTYGGDSPVVVVVNKSEKGRKNLIPIRSIKAQYPQILEVIETSCPGPPKGIDALKENLEKALKALKHLDQPIPSSYFRIKERLQQVNRDFIAFHEYSETCKQTEPAFGEMSMKTLLTLLNDLGIMLSVQGNRRLEDTHVLNPEWVTQGVYKIMMSEILSNNKGIVAEEEIARILDSKAYPSAKARGFIMDMMMHFQLCYQVPDRADTYFVPGAFPKDIPKDFRWEPERVLRFAYHYDILHEKILHQFMVKMHECIKEGSYWRQGVVICRKDQEAFVLADRSGSPQKILIEITGKGDLRRFLAVIRYNFEKVHGQLKKISVKEMVPLEKADKTEFYYEYENLITLEEAGYTEYFIPEIKRKINVRDVLNGIEFARHGKLNDAIIEAWMDKLRHADYEEIIEELCRHPDLKEAECHSQINLLSAQWHDLRKETDKGKLKPDDIRIERSKIGDSIQTLLNKIRRG